MTEKKARISPEAEQAIEDFCRSEGVTFSAPVEAAGLTLRRVKDSGTDTFPRLSEGSPYHGIIDLARSVQGDRRSRRPA